MRRRNQNRNFQIKKFFLAATCMLCTICICAQDTLHATKRITVHIFDENGKPTAARLRMTLRDSVYYAPEGHSTDFPITEREGDLGQGGDVILDNDRRFAYV